MTHCHAKVPCEEALSSPLILTADWNIPLLERQDIPLDNLELISFADVTKHPVASAKRKGVHFFVQDHIFECVYTNSPSYIERLKQYRFVCTPDFSVWKNEPLAKQLMAVYKNRLCGQYWQSHGLLVIPTISWGSEQSFSFCFSGIEKGSTVAISTLGCRKDKESFMRGFKAMMDTIQPQHILCFNTPFIEMQGNIHFIDYRESRKGNH